MPMRFLFTSVRTVGRNIMLPRAPLLRLYSSDHSLSRQDVSEGVLMVLRNFDRVNQSKLSLESQFTSDLGLDSLDVVEVLIAMEERFHMEIPDPVADKIKTPREVVDFVYRALNPDADEDSSQVSPESHSHH